MVLLVIAAVVGVARFTGGVVLRRARLSDPAGALSPPPERARLPARPAAVVVAADSGDRRGARRAHDHAAARKRWAHSRRGPEGRRRPPRSRSSCPGIMLAGLASIGMGLVIGPEATADRARRRAREWRTIKLARKQAPSQVLVVVAAAGSFAALSFVFSSPIIAAIILIEATGLGRDRLPIVLLPGLVGAGIGSAGVDRHGRVYGAEHERLRPRRADAARRIPHPTARRLRLDDRAGARRRRRRLSDPDRGTADPAHREAPAVRAPARVRAGRVRAGDRVLAGQRKGLQRGAVLRAGRPPGAGLRRGNMVAVGARVADRLQGARLFALARQLPGRPDISGHLPRRGRRAHVLASAGVPDRGGGRGRDRRRDRWPSCACRCRRSSSPRC